MKSSTSVIQDYSLLAGSVQALWHNLCAGIYRLCEAAERTAAGDASRGQGRRK